MEYSLRINSENKALVDVPVKTTIWCRTDVQRKQFEVIKKARPSTLLVVSDGGRTPEEWEKILINRRIFDEEIDWDCTVYKLYEEHNVGVWTMINKGHEFVWSKVDECIFLEDDDIPSVSLFQFCKEMLSKYRYDYRIGMICAFNPLGIYERVPYDYFFTGAGMIWGIATWKRMYESFNANYAETKYNLKLIQENSDKEFWKRAKGYIDNKFYDGHVATDEFLYELSRYCNHQLRIFPKYNLVSNQGANSGSAHTSNLKSIPRGIRKLYNMQTYELRFPLKEPSLLLEDKNFEKIVNRILGINHPFIKFGRRIESIFLMIRNGEVKKRLKKKIEKLRNPIES